LCTAACAGPWEKADPASVGLSAQMLAEAAKEIKDKARNRKCFIAIKEVSVGVPGACFSHARGFSIWPLVGASVCWQRAWRPYHTATSCKPDSIPSLNVPWWGTLLVEIVMVGVVVSR
jgi:hypothetical protein